MTQEERGGIIGTDSSGVKMTLKVRLTPMETTPVLTSNGMKCSYVNNLS